MPTMILAAAVAAVLVVAVDAQRPRAYDEPSRQFQSMVGGLGLGSQVDLAHGDWQFDPRLGIDPQAEAPGGGSGFREPWCAMTLFVIPRSTSTASDTRED